MIDWPLVYSHARVAFRGYPGVRIRCETDRFGRVDLRAEEVFPDLRLKIRVGFAVAPYVPARDLPLVMEHMVAGFEAERATRVARCRPRTVAVRLGGR
jgi:hypothetical protein